MQPTFGPGRLTRFGIVAVLAVTAFSWAYGFSNNAKSLYTSSPPSANGKAEVDGQIASVSGNAVQVTQKAGTATVDVSPSTKVIEYAMVQLTDIAAGNCVTVVSSAPAAAPGGPVTAATVSVELTPQGGKCPQPKTGPRKVIGTVASVAGNTINVTVTDANGNPSETRVTVAATTQYNKGASATSQAIAQGKCITARGTKRGGGTLQATVVALGPASNNGQCPQPAVKQHPH